MSNMHGAARAARAKQGGANAGDSRLKLIWLAAALIVLGLSAAMDALTAQPAFWLGAQPFMRAAIGASGALVVLLSAQIARFLLTRRHAPAPPQEEGR